MASSSGRIQATAASADSQHRGTGLAASAVPTIWPKEANPVPGKRCGKRSGLTLGKKIWNGTSSIALLSLAAVLVTSAVLNAAARTARELRDTERTPFFLVASPDMPDPLFQRTVILMLPPTAMPIVAGIVINKPTKMTLGELFSHAPAVRNQAQSVYFGGPVELASPVVLMRAAQAPDATAHLFENVYISIDARSIADILKRPGSEKDVRLFLGRAQWTVDQLHAEILKGAWTLSPARPELVFSSDPAGVWRILAQHAKMREVDLSLEQAFGWCAGVQSDSALSQARWIGPPR